MRVLVNFYPIDVLPREDYLKICADVGHGKMVSLKDRGFFDTVREIAGQNVHAHGRGFPFPEMVGLFAKRSVYTPHFNTIGTSARGRIIRRLLLNRFDYVVAQTAYGKRQYIAQGIRPEKIKVLPIPVDYEYFSQPKGAKEFRKKYGLANEPFALCVGIRAMKNPMTIYNACKKAGIKLVATGFKKRSEVKPGFEWLLPPQEFLDKEGDDLIITGHIDWPELRGAYHAATIFVNSSDAGPECFCLAAYEAAAAGLPLCLPNFGVFDSFKGAALFHRNTNAEKLAANIRLYMSKPRLAKDNAKKAKNVANQFNYPIVKKVFERFYREAGMVG